MMELDPGRERGGGWFALEAGLLGSAVNRVLYGDGEGQQHWLVEAAAAPCQWRGRRVAEDLE